MLNYIPVELILMVSKYLTSQEIELLAFANKRMLKIAKRNWSMLLGQRISISTLRIKQVFEKDINNVFHLEIVWDKPHRYGSLGIDAVIRLPNERRHFEVADKKLLATFLQYYYYTDKVSPNERLDWKTYAAIYGNLNVEKENDVPNIPIHMLLSKADVRYIRFYDKSFDKDHFWRLMKELCTSRVSINSISVDHPIKQGEFSWEDLKRSSEEFPILMCIENFEVTASQFVDEVLLQHQQFKKAVWHIDDLDARQFEKLACSSVKHVRTDDGTISLNGFMTSFLQNLPEMHYWIIQDVENDNKEKFAWEIMAEILNNFQLPWTIRHITAKRKKITVYQPYRKWCFDIYHMDGKQDSSINMNIDCSETKTRRVNYQKKIKSKFEPYILPSNNSELQPPSQSSLLPSTTIQDTQPEQPAQLELSSGHRENFPNFPTPSNFFPYSFPIPTQSLPHPYSQFTSPYFIPPYDLIHFPTQSSLVLPPRDAQM